MSLNYFAGQTPPLFGQNKPVRPVGLTGRTGAGAMVPFPLSPEPIVLFLLFKPLLADPVGMLQ
jgi:hypothetical protein